jgi:hydroxypyruvate reductase
MDYKETLLNILDETKNRFSPYKLLYPRLTNFPMNKPIHIFALGKAAYQMTKAVLEFTKSDPFIRITDGLIITKYGYSEDPLPKMTIIESGHPLPDENSLLAAEAAISFLQKQNENEILLILLSGGGSALMEKPIEGITLNDIISQTNELLLNGADIETLNDQRKKMSAIKGGKMYQYIKPKLLYIYAMSDVPGDKPKYIASNPFLPDAEKTDEVMGTESFRRYDNLTAKKFRPSDKTITYKVIANNHTFCETLKQVAHDIVPSLQSDRIHIVSTDMTGPATKAGAEVASMAAFINKQKGKGFSAFKTPCLLIFGGETSVVVKGNGLGGRCTEIALSAAQGLSGLQNCAVMAYATDGCDGSCEAAGAIVDCNTKMLLEEKGINIQEYLDNNDSYTALKAIDAIIPGEHTGNNVNDIVMMYVQ